MHAAAATHELPEREHRHPLVAADAPTTSASRSSMSLAITVFFFIGGVAATLIRLELVTPAGDLVSADTYNKLFTMHGVVMVWFFLIPSIPATLGNFLLPLMIGARDLAFPRLNLLSWYLYIAGGLFTLAALVCSAASIPAGPSTRRSRRCSPTAT